MYIIKKSVDENVEKLNLYILLMRMKNGEAVVENSLAVFKMFNTKSPHDLAFYF